MKAVRSGRSRLRDGRRMVRTAAAVAVLGSVFACVRGAELPPESGYRRTQPVAGAGERVNEGSCAACHDSFEAHFVVSSAHDDCQACHGPAELHLHTARAGDIRFPSNTECIACHETGHETLFGWAASVHARAGVLCSDCHDTHNREPWHLRGVGEVGQAVLPRAGPGSRMCVSCHPGVVAQLGLPSRHPVAEGMLDCTDCHGAHADRAADHGRPTRVCAECHQEVMGPWIYEHAPVTEDCGYCHTPHGATADFLLEANQPAVCISCHSVPTSGAIHDPYAFTTRCTDCHSAVHGSYTDPVLRR